MKRTRSYQNRRNTLAHHLLKHYRIARLNYSPQLARIHAYFMTGTRKGGVKDLFVENMENVYSHRRPRPEWF